MELPLADEAVTTTPTDPAGAAAVASITAGTATSDASAAAGAASPAAADAPVPDKSLLGTAEEKPADPKADPEKKPDAEADKPVTPADYKLTLPEGLKADDALVSKFLDGAAKGKLSNDTVQALISELGPEVASLSKLATEYASAVQQFQDMNKSWQSECKADPDFGGAKLPDTLAAVRKAWDATLSPDHVKALDAALDLTGAGNHPAILRAFHALASRLGEGGPVQGRPAGAARSPAEIMYPNQARAS
jgi:hypothetical protein